MTALNHRYPPIQGEAELEDEWEGETELEDEVLLAGPGRMSSPLGEEETEWETEDEWEGEEEGEFEAEFEFEFEAEAEAEGESEDELEDEFEAEAEEEAEGFVNPVRRVYRDAELMAHMAAQASESESESEAEAFVGALIPLAARLIPRAGSLLARNAPTLLRGATRIVRSLRRNPQTRRLVKAMPVILQRTAQSLADQAGNGQDIDPTAVVRTLGTMTGRVLRGPGRNNALRAVKVFDRRWHRRCRWARARAGAAQRRVRVPNPYARPGINRRPAAHRRMNPGYGRGNRRGRRR